MKLELKDTENGPCMVDENGSVYNNRKCSRIFAFYNLVMFGAWWENSIGCFSLKTESIFGGMETDSTTAYSWSNVSNMLYIDQPTQVRDLAPI